MQGTVGREKRRAPRLTFSLPNVPHFLLSLSPASLWHNEPSAEVRGFVNHLREGWIWQAYQDIILQILFCRHSGSWIGTIIMWAIIALIAYYIYQHWTRNTAGQYPFTPQNNCTGINFFPIILILLLLGWVTAGCCYTCAGLLLRMSEMHRT